MTSFAEVAQYSKPQPSLMPNVDSVLHEIGKWKYIVITDLLKSFYQIPLANSSMKYCGVATPFKGIHVYTRSAMGMPESETCHEELMSRVWETSFKRAVLPKLLTTCTLGETAPLRSSTIGEEFSNNLRLSAAKTIICPRKAVVLGWVWSKGTLQASPHKLAARSRLPPQCKASAPLSGLTRF